jgi:TRAP-type C4-dicarboxylate transport system permease small subunit
MFRRLERALEMFIALLLGCMSVIVFFNVVARYVFDKAFPWTEEVSLFMFTWVIFLGALIAFERHRHLGVDLIINVLPQFGKKIAYLVASLATTMALCVLLWGGIRYYFQTAGWPAPATQIPYGYINAVIPFSAFFMLLLQIRDIYRFLRSGKPQGQEGSEC